MKDVRTEMLKRRDHLAYSAGISILSLVLSVYPLWSVSHFVSLFVPAAILSFVAWVELPDSYSPQTIMLLFLLAATLRLMLGPALPSESDIHGWLYPADERSAETACPSHAWGIGANLEDPKKMLTVALGNSGVAIPYLPGQSGNPEDQRKSRENNLAERTVLVVGDCAAIKVRRSDDGLAVSADVFDTAGNLAARVRDNEFDLVPAQFSYKERPDKSTLVVHDKEGGELFWVRYLNPNSVKIRGSFACKGMTPVRITDDTIQWGTNHISNGCMRSLFPDSNGIIVR